VVLMVLICRIPPSKTDIHLTPHHFNSSDRRLKLVDIGLLSQEKSTNSTCSGDYIRHNTFLLVCHKCLHRMRSARGGGGGGRSFCLALLWPRHGYRIERTPFNYWIIQS
jgi:hypothetical protein